MIRGYTSVVIAMLVWGSVGIFTRFAEQPPLLSTTYRVVLGALALGAVALAQGRPASAAPLSGKRWLLLGFSGLALALNWLFFFKAIDTTTVSKAVLSYYVAPILVALASPLVLRERLEGRTLVATALAFGGVLVMLWEPGQSMSAGDLEGIGYGLVAACFYTIVTLSGRWLEHVPLIRMVLGQLTIAALVLVPVAFSQFGMAAVALPTQAVLLLGVIGFVHTALALVLYFNGLRKVKVQHVGVLAYLDPVSAVLFAFVFLGEPLELNTVVGGAMVLGGSALLLRKK